MSDSMFTPSMSNAYYSGNNQATFEEKSTLGKDDFLKILVTQLQNQNPLEPLKDREYIAQMTQFSMLEQISNMSEMFHQFVESQTGLASYSQVIGKTVQWEEPVDGEEGSEEVQVHTGVVSAVSSKEDQFYYLIDGEEIPVENVFHIEASQPEPPADGEDNGDDGSDDTADGGEESTAGDETS